MVNLDELKEEIQAIGDKIKALKSTTPIDKDAIGEAAASLLTAKQLYADNNNGIGVDGQPFTAESSSSKKDKKKPSTDAVMNDAKQVRRKLNIPCPPCFLYQFCKCNIFLFISCLKF
jgi:hypothetical protein